MEVKDLERIVTERQGVIGAVLPALMRKVYVWMALALVITGICAYGVAASPTLLTAIYSSRTPLIVLCIAELALVWYTTARINRLSLTTATMLFIIYSALNGVTMSSIFLLFNIATIGKVFFITAGTFAITALWGYTTKKDLTKLGNILFMALIGLILATVVNLFVANSMVDLVLSYIGVILFVGLTAWDSQQIKGALAMQPDLSEDSQKVALMGALSLYLDFINLFLYLLRIFGRSDN